MDKWYRGLGYQNKTYFVELPLLILVIYVIKIKCVIKKCALLNLLSVDVSFDDTEIVPLFSALGFLSFEFLFRQFDSIILNALYKNRNTSPIIIDTHNNFWKIDSVEIQSDEEGKSAFHVVT